MKYPSFFLVDEDTTFSIKLVVKTEENAREKKLLHFPLTQQQSQNDVERCHAHEFERIYSVPR